MMMCSACRVASDNDAVWWVPCSIPVSVARAPLFSLPWCWPHHACEHGPRCVWHVLIFKSMIQARSLFGQSDPQCCWHSWWASLHHAGRARSAPCLLCTVHYASFPVKCLFSLGMGQVPSISRARGKESLRVKQPNHTSS